MKRMTLTLRTLLLALVALGYGAPASLQASPDADRIQSLIDDAVAGKTRAAELPNGRFLIDRTLTIPNVTGLTVRGAGQMHDVRFTGHWGPSTVLIWTGPSGGTLLHAKGASFLTLESLTLIGREGGAKERAGILLHDTSLVGWGSGGWRVSRVSVIDADVGIQSGEVQGDFNNSDHRYEGVQFISCGSGFRVKHDQGLNYHFSSPGGEGTDVVFDMERGGGLHVDGAPGFTNCGWIARFGPGGDNVAVSSFRNIRAEGGARFYIGPYRTVHLDSISYAGAPGPRQESRVEVSGSNVVIDGAGFWSFLNPGWLTVRDGGSVTLRDQTLVGWDRTKLVLKDKGSSVRWRDCWSSWGVRIADSSVSNPNR